MKNKQKNYLLSKYCERCGIEISKDLELCEECIKEMSNLGKIKIKINNKR